MKKYLIISIMLTVNLIYAGGIDIAPESSTVNIDSKEKKEEVGLPLAFLSNVYLGAAIGKVTLDSPNINEELSSNVVTLIAGFNINKYFGIEGRYSRSFQDVTFNDSNDDSMDIDSTYSNLAVYLKAGYDIQNFKPYMLLGYGETQFTNIEGFNRKEAGVQYGAGIEYKVNRNWNIFADYIREYDGTGFDGRARLEDITVDQISLGFQYHF